MTTTMVEAFDAPMLDYPSDIDIHMQPSITDHWISDEATMDDDRPSHQHDSMEDDAVVEVEMDTYDDISIEYDMADGLPQDSHGRELQDVEVYDASGVNSPQPFYPTDEVESHIPTQVSSEQPAENQHASHERGGSEVEEALHMHSSPVFDVQQAEAHPPPTTDAIAEEQQTSRNEEQPADPVPDHQTPDLSNVPQLLPVLIEEPPSESALEAAAESADAAPLQQLDSLHGADNNPPFPTTNTETDTLEDQPDYNREVQSELPPEQVPSVDSEKEEQEQSGDPHEISEGVYIDPPPPVYLFTSEKSYYLFNQPSEDNDLRNAVSSHALGVETTEHHVLLHHKPTLYYEPLSTLCEALRQEAELSGLPDLLDGELVINASQLRLVVPEDNVYAREVTLHELNLLHDASNIPGPLRIQLQIITPRFKTQYRLLQSHFAELHSNDNDYAPEDIKAVQLTDEAAHGHDEQSGAIIESEVVAQTESEAYEHADINENTPQAETVSIETANEATPTPEKEQPQRAHDSSTKEPTPVGAVDAGTNEEERTTIPTSEGLQETGEPEAVTEEHSALQSHEEEEQENHEQLHLEALHEESQHEADQDEPYLPPPPDDSYDEDEPDERDAQERLVQTADDTNVQADVYTENLENGLVLNDNTNQDNDAHLQQTQDEGRRSTPRQTAPTLQVSGVAEDEEPETSYDLDEAQYEGYDGIDESVGAVELQQHEDEGGDAVAESEIAESNPLEHNQESNHASTAPIIDGEQANIERSLGDNWDGEYHDFEEWDNGADAEQEEPTSRESSKTLSSKASVKRSFDEFELSGDEAALLPPSPSSPDPKRARVL